MLRQSLKRFLQSLPCTLRNQAALQKVDENEFHKRLRNELIMLPIPKAKFFDRKVPTGVDRNDFKELIIEKQTHILHCAISRVRNSSKISLDILNYVQDLNHINYMT